MEKVIEIKNLCKSFKDVKAVNDISFEVREGELFAFLGINGAGKSTTINIISGTLESDGGEVSVYGYDTRKDMNKIKEILGIVFQSSVLDQKLSVLDNLKYRASLYGLTKEQFNENLSFLSEKLELGDILNRTLGKLSGGQKRRVDIARALIHKPKILILDEPTTGLDPKTRILVWNLITELRRSSNLTVFLTTHYMEEASDADYVVIIDEGKIIAKGTPNFLKNEYAYDFIRIYDSSDKLLEAIGGGITYVENKSYIEIQVKTTQQAKEFIAAYGEYFSDFEVVKGKMDNVFLNVTGKNLKEVM